MGLCEICRNAELCEIYLYGFGDKVEKCKDYKSKELTNE